MPEPEELGADRIEITPQTERQVYGAMLAEAASKEADLRMIVGELRGERHGLLARIRNLESEVTALRGAQVPETAIPS